MTAVQKCGPFATEGQALSEMVGGGAGQGLRTESTGMSVASMFHFLAKGHTRQTRRDANLTELSGQSCHQSLLHFSGQVSYFSINKTKDTLQIPSII